MSLELWAIIGVGIPLTLLSYHLTGGLRNEMSDMRERMTKLEVANGRFCKGF